MTLIFEQIRTGGDRNFAYLIADGEAGKAVLIDPSYKPEIAVSRASAQGLKVTVIINTHGHGDHTNGNNTAQELTGAEIAAFKDSIINPDIRLQDGEILNIGNLDIKIIHTPGHCDDHIVIYIERYHVAITGDHLFVGKIGGTADESHARQQYRSLLRLYEELPMQTSIWPGHDVGARPSSTLELESASNPFIRAGSFDEFNDLKKNWGEYKVKRGLL